MKNIDILSANYDFARLPTSMTVVRGRLKELHLQYGPKIDLWMHLGQWSMDFVACERRAFRQDFDSSWNHYMGDKHYYTYPDGDGRSVDDLGPNPWLTAPMGLHSEVPIDETVKSANLALMQEEKPLRIASHLEAGAAGCGYTFYESMANCFIAGRRRNVIFVHIPPNIDEVSLKKAKDAVLAVIGGAIDILARQKLEPHQSEEESVRQLAQEFYLTP